ncbi:hypothetical protein SSPS47_27105 [Streptomyces sp. S4.7]|uniref:nitroreductase family deazaflavin-dependent oxidoreductase n=1 Tax=Streptomyces sp. S4.7 TaxID=2705439 RepID=UPI001397096B|nr:nitroreductase family deazaflavin-dependent oxidoreductase [Streptomyces sp. S4.7]QHY98779.1 hypothetical protein SSPS47_27105 [Streptomyces sp. S4.7]
MTPQDTAHNHPQPPAGWRRLGARLPILVFRAGLGSLFRRRLLMLHHLGRVSGLGRRVVLEVVDYDPRLGAWTVASGFGTKADWYRNLRRSPQTVIQVGSRHYAVTAVFLSPEEGAGIMALYARRHPRTAHRLCTLMGFPVDGGEASFRRAGRSIPFVRLKSAPGIRLPGAA